MKKIWERHAKNERQLVNEIQFIKSISSSFHVFFVILKHLSTIEKGRRIFFIIRNCIRKEEEEEEDGKCSHVVANTPNPRLTKTWLSTSNFLIQLSSRMIHFIFNQQWKIVEIYFMFCAAFEKIKWTTFFLLLSLHWLMVMVLNFEPRILFDDVRKKISLRRKLIL